MGIGLEIIEFFNRSISRTIGDLHGMRMAELGDQKLWPSIRVSNAGGRIWAKEMFEARGCHHYSIDIHGKNGSHPLDLAKPIEDPFWHENFDIVTNFGTSEHVDDQYECWKNIHNLGRPGCVYVHVLPEYGRYRPYHCKHFYNRDFFLKLCEANKYTLILAESIQALGHVGACYIKPEGGNSLAVTKAVFLSWIKGPANA